MKLLQSDKLTLPQVYFISNKSEIKEIPIGVPFIFGDKIIEKDLIRIMEYEILYQKAVKSGYPFDFKQILVDNGYIDLIDWWYSHPVYMEFSSEKFLEEDSNYDLNVFTEPVIKNKFKQFIKDNQVYMDIEKLKELNVFPLWLEKIEDAVSTNIHNFSVFNNNMYNKKLEGMYGALELKNPDRNLIIIDISGSIPKGVSSTCLALSKNLCESFYADLLITGSKSTLYSYENLYELDIEKIYDENGMDNDQVYFKKLVTFEEKNYKTAIVFGDNHTPCQKWSNKYNKNTKIISRENAKEMCKWKIDKLISFHTSSTEYTAGYADFFDPKETEKIKDWVKYLKK